MEQNVIELGATHSLLSEWLLDMRHKDRQTDQRRFRDNMESVGFIMAYEISKSLHYHTISIETPLAAATVHTLSEQLVVAAILRAALPLQSGMLRALPRASAAFVSAFRRYDAQGNFEIVTGYEAKPPLDGKTLLVVDPMCATGRSMIACYQKIIEGTKPQKVIFASVFASVAGIDYVRRHAPGVVHYTCAIDPELNAHAYIVPGLGDAGDLAFGTKV
ncbi:MAG: uracil phosphoribosyltransferase [Bacteroidetes bacterium]|nr:uracil phosphoribosyltransferase [Bacteroidota bacterium]